MFKIRASAAGKLMTKAKAKDAVLSQTAISFIEEYCTEQIYGIRKEINSKYLSKGIELEDEAIDKAIEWLDLPFAIKNTERFTNEYATGEPDLILPDEIIDIKCSWDAFTFPLFQKELENKDYFAQLQVYMWLTGKRKSRVVYVLLNTPEHLTWEPQHNYDSLETKYRIKAFCLDYDQRFIDELVRKVEAARELVSQLINNF